MPLDQPLFIVVIFEFLQGDLELFNGVEGSDPEQIFLECSVKRSAHPLPSGARTKDGEDLAPNQTISL